MLLYYSSTNPWPNGHQFGISAGPTHGHLERIKDNNPWRLMEESFEQHRQPNEYSRLTGYFASATLADSAVYSQSQNIDLVTGKPKTDDPIRYYKVFMPQATRCVMKLCEHGMQHHANAAVLAEIAAEYWRQPHGNWMYFEYVGPTMTIIEQVDPPEIIEVSASHNAYTSDHIAARQRWPLPMKT